MIPYGQHSIDKEDIDAVVQVLEHHFLTQGTYVPAFEQALCRYTGAQYAVTVNSGTSGLHVACLALGLGSDDWLWTTPNSFVASANCGLYCGAKVDFVDIDPQTYNLCPKALASKLDKAKAENCLPKAIVVVHFSGASADMQAISALTEPLGIALIEDAAHALGGQYQGQNIGCSQFSAMTVLSFHPVKSITTAEGGAVLTNDAHLANQLALFAKQGVTRVRQQMDENLADGEGPWYYQQIALGYNYRLSDLQAALGMSQLKKLDAFIQRRRLLAQRYQQQLAKLPVQLPLQDKGSAWHLYMVLVDATKRAAVYQTLSEQGVGVNVHYIPIHLQPYYQRLGFSRGDFPVAEDYYSRAITLPLYPNLSEQQQDRVIELLTRALS